MKNSVITIIFPGIDGGYPHGVGTEMVKIFFQKIAVLAQTVERLLRPEGEEYLVWRLSFCEDNLGVVIHGVIEKCRRTKIPDGISILLGAGATDQEGFAVQNQAKFILQPDPDLPDAGIVEYARKLISLMGLQPVSKGD
jgi:hypothetical protein